MQFATGTLVKARGREWVVLPESTEDLLILRPLGGTEDEVTGIYVPLENVEGAQFDLPSPISPGDFSSARLLRDAIRLGFRSSAGPFRAFGKMAVEPRPYQLVPLLVALKLDPVRVLIADDVGIGKTIEACLIGRELLDRGEVTGLAVLCPPHLAEQWQKELSDKFHIEAELVLSSTAMKLERRCRPGESLFDYYPHVIVSTDFIKSDRRRDEFLRTCPELVIVDEAHTCSFGSGTRGHHQRYELVQKLSQNMNRHMILVTATPHSGNEETFRSLLGILSDSLKTLPENLSGKENENYRRMLAEHFVQRRRADIEHYLQTDTPFPKREDREVTYKLSKEYRDLIDKAIVYARESVKEAGEGAFHQRVRWWSALALLRCLSSSPAASASTLRMRSRGAEAEDEEALNEIGRRTVLDMIDDESSEGIDVAPGSVFADEEAAEKKVRSFLGKMADEAESLKDGKDEKLSKAVDIVREFLKDGFNPILFCRFIPTAEHVGEHLRKKLDKSVDVIVITGLLPPGEREERILQIDRQRPRVMICTDCLSEGINLQDIFNAVMHYDLSWNPTRHEQREGRVDRYGQSSKTVRVLTYYGLDNPVDGIVLELLLKKHRTIRNSLGISVPVPVNTEQIVEAVFEGLLLKDEYSKKKSGYSGRGYEQLLLFEDFFKPQKEELYIKWEAAGEREKRSRTMFAQETIKADEVAQELEEVHQALGSSLNLYKFFTEALKLHGAIINENKDNSISVNLKETPLVLRELMNSPEKFTARFEMPVKEGEIYLTRTHPFIEGLSGFVMDSALDAVQEGKARRCGVTATSKVEKATTVLLVRYRFHIITKGIRGEKALLAEECRIIGFEGLPRNARWLEADEAERLMEALPERNVPPEQAQSFLQKIISDFEHIKPALNESAAGRGEKLLSSHRRVRSASKQKGISYQVRPQLPVDVIGIYIYLPA